jgi:hypothetical protein
MARAAAALFLASLMLATAASAAKRAPDCATTGRIVAADAQARVYMVGDDYQDAVYGCVFGSARRTRLGEEYAGSDAAASVWVAGLHGSRVGYAKLESLDVDFWTAKVGDLRADRTLRKVRRSGGLDDLLMTPAGSLAILHDTRNSLAEANAGPGFVQRYVVTTLDPRGATRLDGGPDVDPGSLALAPHRVYWTRGGEPRTARIR